MQNHHKSRNPKRSAAHDKRGGTSTDQGANLPPVTKLLRVKRCPRTSLAAIHERILYTRNHEPNTAVCDSFPGLSWFCLSCSCGFRVFLLFSFAIPVFFLGLSWLFWPFPALPGLSWPVPGSLLACSGLSPALCWPLLASSGLLLASCGLSGCFWPF